jgi:hypothetical protein
LRTEWDTIIVTTPAGRKERALKRCTIEQIESGAARQPSDVDPFDIHHPAYPNRKQMDELKRHFKTGDEIRYFQGLDSGWAIVRNREVVWVLVTSHEY